MSLSRRIKIQLVLFALISLVASAVMIFRYIDVPAMVFGAGHYTVTIDLNRAAGLYPGANVTYRGSQVGRVESVVLVDTGVRVQLTLDSGVAIPSDLKAEVHSVSAIGEQYVDLLPRNGTARPLADGDVIAASNTSVPPDIDALI